MQVRRGATEKSRLLNQIRAREITRGFALESGGARTDWWHPSHWMVATRALAADRADSNTSLPWLRALAPGAPTSGFLGAEILSISRSTVASRAVNAGPSRSDSWFPSLQELAPFAPTVGSRGADHVCLSR